MANDKLRDLTPVDVSYAPGERPTDEKLEGGEVQTKEGFEYIEAAIGDAYGESLQKNLAFISNFTRDIGDRSKLNPVLMPDVFESNYIQDLTLGDMEHELDLIPVGTGASLITSSADSSVVPGQYKALVSLLEVPGDWTILPGKTENGVAKNSRKLVTHSPSSGGTVTFASVTSGRGSAYVGARHNTIPSVGQANSGGPFLSVSLSDAINNIYTVQLPVENTVEDQLYANTSASISNTKSSVSSGLQMRLPSWMFDAAGLDMGSDASGGGPKTFPLNTIHIYDWTEGKIVDGLLEVKASTTAGLREQEIVCTFRSDIILDTGAGQYILVTSGTSISEMIGALQRDLYFHKHMGDDMIRGISHSDLYGLRTGDDTLDRSKYYGASNIDKNDHSMYLHRDGYTSGDIGGGGNVMRGSIIIGNTNLGGAGAHEHFNLLDDSFQLAFGEDVNGGKLYFDKVRVHNLPEGRGNIPQNFSDTSLVIEGSRDDGSGLLKTVLVDGNFRVDGDVVLGTDQTDDVVIPGDIYIKNSMVLIPRTAAGLTPETGMSIYSSDENAPVFWNGTAWVNSNSIGYAAVVGDGVVSFGKYNGTDAATVQAAIDDAVAQGGGKVKILRGNYSYGATSAIIKSDVIIEGEGDATKIASTNTAFVFQSASDHAGLHNLTISATTTGVQVDGANHHLDGLVFTAGTIGVEILATASGTKIGSKMVYSGVTTRIENHSTNPTNTVSRVKPTNFANGFYLMDYTNKAEIFDKWKRISGSGSLLLNTGAGLSKIGERGRFEITGTGKWVFEDYLPVNSEVGMGGYIHVGGNSSNTITVGFESYNEDFSLLSPNPAFILNSASIGATEDFRQNIVVNEGGSQLNFPVGTRFVRAVIEVTANAGTVYFDGYNLFPMTFSTITLYS